MDDELEQLLKSLKLRGIAEVLDRELKNANKHGVSYTTLLKRLLRHEREAQGVRAMEYRIRRAKLPERWSLGTYPWKRQPSVDRRVIEQLAELDFMSEAENIVFIGQTALAAANLRSTLRR